MIVYVGIDFSINSPGICIKKDDKYHFISYYNSWGRTFSEKIIKMMQIPLELTKLSDTSVELYYRDKKTKDYAVDELNKVKNATYIAESMVQSIKDIAGDSEVVIGIEGFSYGSKGNSAIDLIMFNSILRREIYRGLSESLSVFSPSAVKKVVNKGNSNKVEMLESFLSNKLKDKDLVKGDFYKWCKKNKETYLKKGEIAKPIDDLVDAYFVLIAAENYSKENDSG